MATEESEISRLEQANSLGLEFVKTTVLLNGGAILALLTFIGNASSTAAIRFEVTFVKYSMWAFLLGITSILLALILSYSFTATAPQFAYHQFWNKYIISVNTILGMISVVAFIAGVASLIIGATAA